MDGQLPAYIWIPLLAGTIILFLTGIAVCYLGIGKPRCAWCNRHPHPRIGRLEQLTSPDTGATAAICQSCVIAHIRTRFAQGNNLADLVRDKSISETLARQLAGAVPQEHRGGVIPLVELPA